MSKFPNRLQGRRLPSRPEVIRLRTRSSPFSTPTPRSPSWDGPGLTREGPGNLENDDHPFLPNKTYFSSFSETPKSRMRGFPMDVWLWERVTGDWSKRIPLRGWTSRTMGGCPLSLRRLFFHLCPLSSSLTVSFLRGPRPSHLPPQTLLPFVTILPVLSQALLLLFFSPLFPLFDVGFSSSPMCVGPNDSDISRLESFVERVPLGDPSTLVGFHVEQGRWVGW